MIPLPVKINPKLNIIPPIVMDTGSVLPIGVELGTPGPTPNSLMRVRNTENPGNNSIDIRQTIRNIPIRTKPKMISMYFLNHSFTGMQTNSVLDKYH